MYPIVAITGATCIGKTELAVSIAKKTGANILPLDQLHRYKYLNEGTGLDMDKLGQVKHFGYQILTPWEVSGPDKYVLWLRNALISISENGPTIIEGGCTSYLRKIVASQNDSVLSQIQIAALDTNPSENVNEERIEERVTIDKVAAVIEETYVLEEKGFLSVAGIPFLVECERLWTHPEREDKTLAWAIRISARIYCPAYLALKGRISYDGARAQIVRNIKEIQRYQNTRIHQVLRSEAIYREEQISDLAEKLISTLSQNSG